MEWLKIDLSGQFDLSGIPPIDHSGKTIFLGSCFSSHIDERMRLAGFDTVNNPFGVIFHPVALASAILKSLDQDNRIREFQQKDVWLSYDAHSSVYESSQDDLRKRMNSLRSLFSGYLHEAKTLIITFGSAKGHKLLKDGGIAANCHKTPSAEFESELTSAGEMYKVWSEALDLLKKVNPQLNIILTVSPVRYSREGWIENNRSKARLFELCRLLQESHHVSYFPAFEIVNDLLRDYRFFEKDGVHPNSLAVDEVWKVFSDSSFSEKTKAIVHETMLLRDMENHRLLFPGSSEAVKFRESFETKKTSLLQKHPFIRW